MTRFVIAPPKVMDNSVLDTHSRCPRLAYYQYVLNRAPVGRNFPIGFGIAYHKFMELVENEWAKWMLSGMDKWTILDNQSLLNALLEQLFDIAASDYDEPPIGHKKDWMTRERLRISCELAFGEWQREKVDGRVEVLFTEQAFTLMLPNGRPFGGRFDQIIRKDGELWARDFKTTSRMGPTFGYQFLVNNQMTGYTWASSELSGQVVEGVRVEVMYNTKTKGPKLETFLATRPQGIIEQWQATVDGELIDFERHMQRTDELGMLAWPQRTAACNDYGGCYFRDACSCEYEPSILDWLDSNTEHSVWDFTNPDVEIGIPE